ncbi:MAG: hypothetical protein AAFO85_19040, partial [Cyanobacteria bacterium J06598_4]
DSKACNTADFWLVKAPLTILSRLSARTGLHSSGQKIYQRRRWDYVLWGVLFLFLSNHVGRI